MYRRLIILLAIVCLFLSIGNASAGWDGQRKGFLLGIGLGPGMISFSQEIEAYGINSESDSEQKATVLVDFRIGYAPSNVLEIYYTGKASAFTMKNILGDDVEMTSGVSGLGVTYFMKPVHPSPFFTGCIGMSTWDTSEDDGDPWQGFGIGVGAGYEFSKRWSLEGILTWGNPGTDIEGMDFTTKALNFAVTINIMGY